MIILFFWRKALLNIREHIGKITWTGADKALFVLYGLVSLVQMRYLEPADLGLWGLLAGINTWIFIVSDGLALQSVIQFGPREESRGKLHLYALALHSGITLGAAATVFAASGLISKALVLPRFREIALALPIYVALMIPRTYCLKFLYRDYELRNVFFMNLAFFLPPAALTLYFIMSKGALDFGDMILIAFSGAAASSITAATLARKKLVFGFKGETKAREILNFGLPVMLTSSLHSAPKYLDLYVVQYFFSTSAVGVYFSAKTLFRFFEDAVNAAHGLVYPASVKRLGKNDPEGFTAVMTKSASFVLFAFAAIALMLEAGGTRLLVETFLPEKYYYAIGQFNLLVVGAIFMPFFLLSSVITATGRPDAVLKHTAIAAAVSFATFFLVGYFDARGLIPLGIVVYCATLAALFYNYARLRLGFKPAHIFRAAPDVWRYLRGK